MQKLNLRMLLLSSLLYLGSCAGVPNIPVCAEISMSKGICTYSVSGETIVVDDEHPLEGQTWWDMRAVALTMPAQSWAKLKAYMVKMCKQYKCNVDIESWDRN